MNYNRITIKENELKRYILKNFKEDALLEISYNRVFVPGKIICIYDDASITLQLKGQLLNQRVDIDFEDIKSELVEIIYTYQNESTIISIID